MRQRLAAAAAAVGDGRLGSVCWNGIRLLLTPHHPPPHHPHPLSPQRYNYPERIATAVDDYVQRSRQRGGGKDGAGGGGGPPGKQQQQNGGDGVGWGCPRVRYVFISIHLSRPPVAVVAAAVVLGKVAGSSGGGGGAVMLALGQ